MKLLVSHIGKYKAASILSPVFKLLEACFELIVPLIVAGVIDNGIRKGDAAYVWYVYAKVDPEKTEIVVVKGYDDTNDLNSYFMTKEQQEKIASHYGDKVEYAYVTTVAYDIHGKQLGSPNKRTLQRTNNGRWYVREYDVRF